MANYIFERTIGREADAGMADMQASDGLRTLAEITTTRRDLEFELKTPIEIV